MSLTSQFHPEATAEFRAEVAWYDGRQDGLGARFETAVFDLIDDLLDWPNSGVVWPDAYPTQVVQSYGVPDFPYRVVYLVKDEELFIVAVASDHREPGYWRNRLATT